MTVATLDGIGKHLAEALPGRMEREAPLGALTTYRTGGAATVLVRPQSRLDLEIMARIIDDAPVALLVVGRGSNLLVADEGFPGIAVVLNGEFEAISLDDDAVRAGGAVALPVLARHTASAGRAGLEFFVGIPGSVGGAVRMNAGGHGTDTAAVLRQADLIDVRSGAARAVGPGELSLAYRHSNVRPSEIVVEATFCVAPDDPAACEARLAEIVRWRRAHQPGGSNAGSVFRNPPNDAAGRLIDACGLKGLQRGGAAISGKHANFIQASEHATAADVRALVLEVQQRVAEATGVTLEPELCMVGFAPDALP